MRKGAGSDSEKSGGLKGFLSGLFSGILGGADPDREKHRQLKEIRKELKKRGKFFKVNGSLAQPGMAKWFHNIYVVMEPASVLLERYRESDVLKNVLIEYFLPEPVCQIVENLGQEKLRERVQKTSDLKAFTEEIKRELGQIHAALNPDVVRKINGLYAELCKLQNFAAFDFHFLLKKFDSSLPDQDYKYTPKFEPVNAKYIQGELMDFLEVYYGLNGEADWDTLFDILKAYRETDFISRTAWRKLLVARREMVRYRTLDLVIRLVREDPHWVALPAADTHDDIVDHYLSKIKIGAEGVIQEVLKARKERRVEQILQKLFGTTSVSRTQYYTERANLTFHKKSLVGFKYAAPVNYLKAYYLDFYKSHVRVLCDLLLIQGKWADQSGSMLLSEVYHDLFALADRLTNFDGNLSDDGPEGSKIKRFLLQSTRDRSALVNLRAILDNLNEEAKKIINASAQSLIVRGKNIKMLQDEYGAGSSDVILNWKEIESWAETPLADQMRDVYNSIFYMVQLLQIYMKKS